MLAWNFLARVQQTVGSPRGRHAQNSKSRASVRDVRCRRSEEKALMKTAGVFQDQKQAQGISGTILTGVVCIVLDGRVERDEKT
jgi:hypothetical protein